MTTNLDEVYSLFEQPDKTKQKIKKSLLSISWYYNNNNNNNDNDDDKIQPT